MIPSSSMSSPPVSNNIQETPSKLQNRDRLKVESTSDGDVRTFVVEPSFDDGSTKASETAPAKEEQPVQEVSPSQSKEEPTASKRKAHSRNLSAHFFDATKISEDPSKEEVSPPNHRKAETGSEERSSFSVQSATKVDGALRSSPPSLGPRGSQNSFRESPTARNDFLTNSNQTPSGTSPAIAAGQKHSRGRSGDFSNQALAHRRINSIGNSAPVDRTYGGYPHAAPYYPGPSYNPGYSMHPTHAPPRTSGPPAGNRENRHHQREGSAGLDMLTAAIADVSKEELAAAAGNREPQPRAKPRTWDSHSAPPPGEERPPHPDSHPPPHPHPPHPDSRPPPQPHPPHPDSRPPPLPHPPHPDSRSPPPSHPQHGPPPGDHRPQYDYPPPNRGHYPLHPPPPSHGYPGPMGPPPTHMGHPTYNPPPPPPHAHLSTVQYYHPPQGHPPPYPQRGVAPSPVMPYHGPPPPTHSYPVQYSQHARGSSDPDSYNKSMPQQPPANKNEPRGPYERIDTDENLFVRKSPGPSPPPPPPHSGWPGANRGGTTTGVQTHVTAISTGTGNKTMEPTVPRGGVGASSDSAPTGNDAPSSIPSTVGHHRKMSSFSSLGFALFSESSENNVSQPAPPHHRVQSSTTSFLNSLEESDPFFQNLNGPPSGPPAPSGHHPRASPTSTYAQVARGPPPAFSRRPPESTGIAAHQQQQLPQPQQQPSGRALASGGTSRRIRRKCTVADCPNRVVQGGLCIAHGAKRKQCKHPGCTKNVKKAGLCSTHGPARKRCDYENCTKVAVQGGRCIAHGAKKKLCSVENCTKQAILAGMCKKHHDLEHGIVAARGSRAKKTGALEGQPASQDSALCVIIDEPSAVSAEPPEGQVPAPAPVPVPGNKPSHKRGLSIFQDMSAEAVQSLLSNDEADVTPAPW